MKIWNFKVTSNPKVIGEKLEAAFNLLTDLFLIYIMITMIQTPLAFVNGFYMPGTWYSIIGLLLVGNY
jgi:hypothetical protein